MAPSASAAGQQQQQQQQQPQKLGPTHQSHIFTIPRSDPTNHSYRSGDDAAEQPRAPDSNQEEQQETGQDADREKPDIHIPSIPPVPSMQPHKALAAGLVGRYVDEFGNVLDWDGTVLGQVTGDLPTMIGRPVSSDGKILDESGDQVGYVSDNYVNPLRPLTADLVVDKQGTIYDAQGEVVGRMKNGTAVQDGNAKSSDAKTGQSSGQPMAFPGAESSGNASQSRSAATPNPSEIYLDVKSTHDGIQIILKIPTVFNNGDEKEKQKEGS